MQQYQAETVALKALGWLAQEDELLPVFLGASGASLADIREAAASPGLMLAVLDFLAMDDAWLAAFCDAEGLAYDTPMRARQALPGGGEVHWT